MLSEGDETLEMTAVMTSTNGNQQKEQEQIYAKKLMGSHAATPPRASWQSIVTSFTLSFLGILAVASIHTATGLVFIIGSFGAGAVLMYNAIDAELAQPRNVIGGQVISALIGVSIHKLFEHMNLVNVECALAVSLAIVAMDLTRTLHPPGGATSLIAVIGGEDIWKLGYGYVFSPVLLGSLVMVLVAVLGNNCSRERHYPKRWL